MQPTRMLRLVEGNLQFSKSTFRAPFKVHCLKFSPANDLLAIGARNGEIMLKRTSWKKIWKINVSLIGTLGVALEKAGSLDCLEFSPDGLLLAAALNNGHVHIVDIETGFVKHSLRIGETTFPPSVLKLRWCKYDEAISEPADLVGKLRKRASENRKNNDPRVAPKTREGMPEPEDVAFICDHLKEDSTTLRAEDGQLEALNNSYVKLEQFNASYRDTVLLVVRDDLKVSVLAAGVLPLSEIDFVPVLEPLEVSPIMLYDAIFSRSVGGITVAATTCGPRPFCGEDPGVFGKPTQKPGSENCVHTHIYNFKFELPHPERIWDVAFRYLRMCYSVMLFKTSFETTQKNWANEMTGSSSVQIGDVLLDVLIAGASDSAGESYLERGMGPDGTQAMHDFLERHLTALVHVVRGQLSSAARSVAFHMSEFVKLVDTIKFNLDTKNNALDIILRPVYDDTITSASASRSESSERIVSSATSPILDQLKRDRVRLQHKVSQLCTASVANLHEMVQLVRWLMLIPANARTAKVNLMVQSRRIDIAQLIRYILNTFIVDETKRKSYEEILFDLDGFIERLVEKDEESDFDELEYYNEAKEQAAVDHAEIKKELLALRPEYIGLYRDANRSKSSITKRMGLDENASIMVVGAEDGTELDRICVDRIGSFFTDELSAKSLEVIGERDHLLDGLFPTGGSPTDACRTYGLTRVFRELCETVQEAPSVLDALKLSKGHLELDWAYEVETSKQHQGFQNIELLPFVPHVDEQEPADQSLACLFEDPIMEMFKDEREQRRAKKTYRHRFSEEPNGNLMAKRALHVMGTTKYAFYALTLVPNFEGLILGDREPGLQYDQSIICRIDETTGLESLVEQEHKENVNIEERNSDAHPDQLMIDVSTEAIKYSKLIEFECIYPVFNSDFYALARFKASDGSTIRKMVKLCCNEDTWTVQVESRPVEPIESLIICGRSSRGAYTFDESMRVAIFSLKDEKIEEDDREKAEAYDEYHEWRQNSKKRPSAARHPPPKISLDDEVERITTADYLVMGRNRYRHRKAAQRAAARARLLSEGADGSDDSDTSLAMPHHPSLL
ncbi:unnamed protein product [Caenorhabditis auriculariae]|uniref:Anaphase-promoting complex subunit 4-like WD40 domain-containing protein n=1 Tax=Caenorhabditis auriculariae TaxID=2777116 RepID=A0A8S1HTW3_9PELO|nr:unnamed protein product [Caenorhabditis auriculariae]